MANLSKVIYINEEDYSTLLNGGTITKGGVTYSHDPTALYVIKNVSAPEYAETAGYATTAGQATKATQDGGGNVISETYAKKAIIGILTNSNNVWSCDRTYSQLASAMLAGDIVLLKQGNTVYYPIAYPYLNENDEVAGVLRFRYIGSEGYSETFLINTDSTIDYEEDDLEDYYSNELGFSHQRTVLRLTIGQNNTLTFTDQDNNTISTSRVYDSIINRRNHQDIVIQYNGLEYHKSYYDDSSCITFSSVDNIFIYYLVFDCGNLNTVSLDSQGSIGLSNIVRSISVPGQVKLPNSSGIISLVDEFNAKEDAQKVLIRANIIPGDNPTISFTDVNNNNLTHLEVHQLLENYKKDVVFYRGSLYYTLQYFTSSNEYYYQNFEGDQGTFHYFFIYWDSTNNTFSVEVEDIDYARLSDIKYVVSGTIYNSSTVQSPTRNFNQIKSAYDAGKLVVFIDSQDKYEYYCIKCDSSEAIFFNSDTTYGLYTVKVTSSNVWSVDITEILSASTTTPLIDGTAAIGSSTSYARADHVHPRDTSKQDALVSGTNIKTVDGESLLGLGNIDTTFIVEITYDTDTNTYRASETFANIYTAWNNGNGKDIICTTEGYTFQLYYVDSNTIYFSSLVSDINVYCTIQINSNDVVSRSFNYINNLANDLTTTEPGQALDATQGRILKNMITAQQVRVGSVAGKLYRNNVGGTGNFSISGNSGCIPNLTAGTFLVSIYAKSATQSYTFRFNFGSSVSYDLSTTNGEISDVRQITIPSSGTFSGSVLNSSVASGTILYVVMYDYLTPVTTVGPAAVTNRYADLDGTPTLPSASNTTPLLVRGSSGSAGSSGAYARADHKHAICKSFGSYSSLVADTDAQLGEIRYDSDEELFYIYDANNSNWVRLDNKDILPLIIDITYNNDTYICNKTNVEIYKAWQAGRDVYVRRGGEYLYPLASEPGSTFAYFMGPRYDELGVFDRIYISTVNSTQQVTTTNMIMPLPGSSNPQMDGTASPGAANTTTYSKSDHVHPSDTSRVPTSRTINGHALSSDLYLTVFGNLGPNGFERDIVNSQGAWAGAEIVTPDPYTTYIDITQDKLYRYNPVVGGGSYVEVGSSGTGSLTSGALTDLTDIL